MPNSENESPDNRSHHPRHLRYTAVGTAAVPPANHAPGRQPMQAPRSMPTAGLPRAPRTPRPASVAPAPPPVQLPAEPTPIHGHAGAVAAGEPTRGQLGGAPRGEPMPEGFTPDVGDVPDTGGGTPESDTRRVPGWPASEHRH